MVRKVKRIARAARGRYSMRLSAVASDWRRRPRPRRRMTWARARRGKAIQSLRRSWLSSAGPWRLASVGRNRGPRAMRKRVTLEGYLVRKPMKRRFSSESAREEGMDAFAKAHNDEG